jgi:hypothetical protein
MSIHGEKKMTAAGNFVLMGKCWRWRSVSRTMFPPTESPANKILEAGTPDLQSHSYAITTSFRSKAGETGSISPFFHERIVRQPFPMNKICFKLNLQCFNARK